MTPSPLYETHACGPDTNPKESGYYLTGQGKVYYDLDTNEWYDSHPIAIAGFGGYDLNGCFWLKPISKSIEQIQEDAWQVARETEFCTCSEGEIRSIKSFSDYRSEYLKQQDK